MSETFMFEEIDMRMIAGFLTVVLMGPLLASCSLLYGSEDEEAILCTGEFVIYTIKVIDEQGEPVDGMTLTVENTETGHVYGDFGVEQNPRPGVYVIFTDAFMGEISREGARVEVTGVKGDARFSETFVFRSGTCHVEKVAGPEIVVLK